MWQVFNKHPLSISFYLIYLLLMCKLGWVAFEFSRVTETNPFGAFADISIAILGIAVAIIFSIITFINLRIHKNDRKFYKRLLLWIAVPAVLLLII